MKKMRLLAFLVTACLATTCFLSGTVAKYSSTATGTASPTVAKWSFTVKDSNIAESNTFYFAPFAVDAIKDSDGNAETDVVGTKIAPGTSGSFVINLENTSEVTAKYTFTFAGTTDGADLETGVTVPLKFSLTGGDTENDWVSFDNIATLATQTGATNTLSIGASTTVTVFWKWDFEQGTDDTLASNDANDVAFTKWANTAGNSVTITATVTATQED